MADIKTKIRGTVKTIDKAVIQTQKFKDNIMNTREKVNEYTEEINEKPENLASTEIQTSINYSIRKGTEKFNDYGRKSVDITKENIVKGKEKIVQISSKIMEKRAEKLAKDTAKRTIKNNVKTTIKTGKESTRLTSKGIKTSEKVIKNTEKVAQESIRLSQRVAKIARQATRSAIKTTQATIKATIKAIKAIILATKVTTSLIMAGGWIAIIIILIIVLIAGFVAVVLNGDGNENFDYSQIPSSEIILVAKAQIGNDGGDKFWQWYGFEHHVAWCACYVSWCADQCGYIDKGIIPKFSSCDDGINWFKENNQWNDRSDSYYPFIGDIIFFDWYDSNGNQDGISDHVGIVTRTDIVNKVIYTIEGNTDNKCAERMYSFNDNQVMGYGTPKY